MTITPSSLHFLFSQMHSGSLSIIFPWSGSQTIMIEPVLVYVGPPVEMGFPWGAVLSRCRYSWCLAVLSRYELDEWILPRWPLGALVGEAGRNFLNSKQDRHPLNGTMYSNEERDMSVNQGIPGKMRVLPRVRVGRTAWLQEQGRFWEGDVEAAVWVVTRSLSRKIMEHPDSGQEGGWFIGAAVKVLFGMPTSHIRAPDFESCLCCWFQLPATVHPGRQQVKT